MAIFAFCPNSLEAFFLLPLAFYTCPLFAFAYLDRSDRSYFTANN